MSEPVYFAVIRHHGRETPRLYFDVLPKLPEMVYCTRLNWVPGGEAWSELPLYKLMMVYRMLKRAKNLPPDLRAIGTKKPPPGEQAGAKDEG